MSKSRFEGMKEVVHSEKNNSGTKFWCRKCNTIFTFSSEIQIAHSAKCRVDEPSMIGWPASSSSTGGNGKTKDSSSSAPAGKGKGKTKGSYSSTQGGKGNKGKKGKNGKNKA